MSQRDPRTITLSAAEVRLVLYAIGHLISHRWFGKRPLPRGFYALQARLVSFVGETKSCASQPHSRPSEAEELVDTNGAAAILGCTPQWVGRIRDRLGVREIGNQRVFPRQTVVDYAERKAGQ